MEHRKQMNVQNDLKTAMDIIESHGITLSFETELEVKGRRIYLAGLLEPIRLDAEEESEKIAATYWERNKLRRSVILFQIYMEDFPATATVIMPCDFATFDQIVNLLKAIREIVSYDQIIIDDLDDNLK